jgi:hypothetical protein
MEPMATMTSHAYHMEEAAAIAAAQNAPVSRTRSRSASVPTIPTLNTLDVNASTNTNANGSTNASAAPMRPRRNSVIVVIPSQASNIPTTSEATVSGSDDVAGHMPSSISLSSISGSSRNLTSAAFVPGSGPAPRASVYAKHTQSSWAKKRNDGIAIPPVAAASTVANIPVASSAQASAQPNSVTSVNSSSIVNLSSSTATAPSAQSSSWIITLGATPSINTSNVPREGENVDTSVLSSQPVKTAVFTRAVAREIAKQSDPNQIITTNAIRKINSIRQINEE